MTPHSSQKEIGNHRTISRAVLSKGMAMQIHTLIWCAKQMRFGRIIQNAYAKFAQLKKDRYWSAGFSPLQHRLRWKSGIVPRLCCTRTLKRRERRAPL
jgi:hypothetical protein